MDPAPDLVRLEINGEPRTLAVGSGLLDVILSLDLPAQGVLIEHNGLALLRDEWPQTRLADGDRLEILRVVAGG